MKLLLSVSSVNNWYGLRARPAGPSAVPDGHNKILSPQEALKLSALKGVRSQDIRHGAISYPQPLSASLIKAFELVDFSQGIVNYDARTPEAKASVINAIAKRVEEKVDYLSVKMKSFKVVGPMCTITMDDNYTLKFGYKGTDVAILGFSELTQKVKHEADLEEVSDQIFYLLEDNQ